LIQFENRLLPFMVKTGQWVGKKSLPGCQLSGCNLKIILIFVQSCLEERERQFKILALATDQNQRYVSVLPMTILDLGLTGTLEECWLLLDSTYAGQYRDKYKLFRALV